MGQHWSIPQQPAPAPTASGLHLPEAGWCPHHRHSCVDTGRHAHFAAGGGGAYIQARDQLLRACAQLGANALANNTQGVCFLKETGRTVYQTGAVQIHVDHALLALDSSVDQ